MQISYNGSVANDTKMSYSFILNLKVATSWHTVTVQELIILRKSNLFCIGYDNIL